METETDYSSSPVKSQIRAMEIRCAPPKPTRKSNTLAANSQLHYTTESPGSNRSHSANSPAPPDIKKNNSKNCTDPGRQSRYVESKDMIKNTTDKPKDDDDGYSDIDDDCGEDGERDSNYEIPMYNSSNYHATYITRDRRKGREGGSFIARKMRCELDFNSRTMCRMCIIACVLLVLVIIIFAIYGVVMKRACPLPPALDCAELLRRDPLTPSGIYVIRPRVLNEDIDVYCDMETTGGGWTVIQRRTDGSQDFDRDWFEYRQGFGDVGKEFWLGNEKIHFLTLQGHYELRIDMEDINKKTSFVEYSYFWLGSETNFYKLHYTEFLGGVAATDRLFNHKEIAFSTSDRDHDLASTFNCAKYHHGGWWFNQCKDSNLNGRYFPSGIATEDFDEGVTWDIARVNGTIKSLTFTEMKVRPDIF